jgi:amino acid permease
MSIKERLDDLKPVPQIIVLVTVLLGILSYMNALNIHDVTEYLFVGFIISAFMFLAIGASLTPKDK